MTPNLHPLIVHFPIVLLKNKTQESLIEDPKKLEKPHHQDKHHNH